MVEDNPINTILTSDTIRLYNPNIKIDTAENGKVAIKKIKKKMYDLIILDIQMPVMDGIEATKTIDDQYRNIKVIAVSFHSELHDIKTMLEAGARNYLIKEEITPKSISNCLYAT